MGKGLKVILKDLQDFRSCQAGDPCPGISDFGIPCGPTRWSLATLLGILGRTKFFLEQQGGIPHHLVLGVSASFFLRAHGLLYAANLLGVGRAKESPLSLPLPFFFCPPHYVSSTILKMQPLAHFSPVCPPGYSPCSSFSSGSPHLTRVCLLFAPALFLENRSACGFKDPQSCTAWRVKPKLLTWPLVSFPQHVSNLYLWPPV